MECAEVRTIKTSAIKKAIYVAGNNPISGDVAVHVSVEDEGGGAFIVIETVDDDCGKISIDLDELEAVLVAAREMIAEIEGRDER
jgi:hypothetical protein